MIRVGVLGATGYTGLETIHWLLQHPQVEITALTSRHPGGRMISDLHPHLVRRLKLPIEDCSISELASNCDVVLSCLPHGASAHRAADLLAAGCRVIDLSADFRLNTPAQYERWYGEKHPEPARLGVTPYGLTELFPESHDGASLIANPGCSGAATLLPLAPLIKERLVDPDDVIVDSKSGASSEGRLLRQDGLFCEINESVTTYSVGSSRHQPEILDIVERYAGVKIGLSFTQHIVPMERGVMVSLYLKPTGRVSPNQIRECLISYYHNSPFVRVISQMPATRFVARTNFVDISVRENGHRICVNAVLDNLGKGGAGSAIQNLNSMFGLPNTMGLISLS